MVVYLRTLNPYLNSSFLIVILRIQLELICWATTLPVIITLLTLICITYTPSPLIGPIVVPAIRFRYIILIYIKEQNKYNMPSSWPLKVF